MTDVEKLLAYEEIRQLASRYAVYSDARDMEALVDLYVPDVRVGRDAYGREALRADMDRAFRGVGVTFLPVGNHVIDLVDDDHATGIVYCRGEIQDGIDSDRWIIHAIQYHDTYERRDGHWLFVRRKHFLVYGAELGQHPLQQEPRTGPRTRPRPATPTLSTRGRLSGVPRRAEGATHEAGTHPRTGRRPLDDVEELACGDDDVILDVGACGIADLMGYAKLSGVTGPANDPMPIGHELAGTVRVVGANCRDVARVGDRVALHPGAAGFGLGNGGPEGGFAPRLLVRGAAAGRSLFPIPDDMTFAHGALAEPLGVGMHAVDQSEARPGDRVAVLGAGPIGLSAIATLADRGIEDIVSVDMSDTRLDVARKLGATHDQSLPRGPLSGLGRIHGTETLYWMENVGTNVFIEATGVGLLLPKSSTVARRRAGSPSSPSTVSRSRSPSWTC